MPDLSGACACGRITSRSAASPFRSVVCHCASCRTTQGTGPVGYMGFGKVSVVWTGQREFRVPATGVTRGACADCSKPLSYMCTRWPGELYVHAATLTDPALFRPEAHIHWAEHLPGTRAMDDLPRYDGRGPSDLPSQTTPARDIGDRTSHSGAKAGGIGSIPCPDG